jgi:7-cyano-7-deazaguanine synthase in queuosine biosynthesis
MSAGNRPDNRTVAKALHRALHKAFPSRSSRKLSSLLMLSGGLDSVALLVNILEETDQWLHAHHIEIHNFENRVEAENDAMQQTLAYCRKHYRQFSLSTSTSEFPLGMGGGFDLTLVLFTAARVNTALGRVIDIVYTGHISPTRSEVQEGTAVFDACYTTKRHKPKWLRPLAQLKKVDIYESIPRELAEMTWSCRKPAYSGSAYEPCGKCHTCKSLAEAYKILGERGERGNLLR